MTQIIQTLLGIIGFVTLSFLTILLIYSMFKLGIRVWDKIEKL